MTGPTRAPATLAADLAGLVPLGNDLMNGTCESGRIFRKRVPDQFWSEITDDLGPVAYVEGDDETAPVVAEYLAALVNAHRAGHLVTLDAALDWVAEQLTDPEVIAHLMNWVPLCMLRNHHGPAPQYDNITEAATEFVTAALAALRDRAAPRAPQPDTTHDTEEQP